MKPLETLRLIQCSEQPLKNYSLKWPELIDFCEDQDKVLWSAREAVAIDKDCFYRTRTACVYFQLEGKTYIAVTDSPEPSRNILLARAQEIHEIHNKRHSSCKGRRLLLEKDSVFSLEDNIIQAMIADASAEDRVVEVDYGYDDSGLGECGIRNFGNSNTFWNENENFWSSMPECFLSGFNEDKKKSYKNHPLIRAVFGNLGKHESALGLKLWGGRYLNAFPNNKGVITWLNGKLFKMHDIPNGSAEVRMFSIEFDNYYKAPRLRLDTGFEHQSNNGHVNGRGVSR